ncbi:MAG: UDP-N-acetylglucosamine 2-epimerase (non-hydrolyzing) [Bacteroidota bacterium]|nr:UDP-N-acetylglucosamine 2-epimerase (non-hydrolyzing) [Bacteroidota bacterium]
MHVCTLVGARPQFVKAAAVSPALKEAGIKETLIHSGQHYDTLLSQVFFEELGVPAPVSNLEAGSGSHAKQTGDIMVRLERFIEETGPYDAVIVYGDTNTTLAGALVAAKGNIPLAHVEAGIRSFNWLMPEEINRILTDRVSKWLFAPTEIAVENLNREGLSAQTILVGDVMLDATHMFAERARERWPLESMTHHPPKGYFLATVHRPSNTDIRDNLQNIFNAFGKLPLPIILPLHPRTRAALKDIAVPDNVEIRDPVSYLAMLTLTSNAHRVLTDSGGLQKEAYWFGVSCVILREETEYPETFENNWSVCAGADHASIVNAAMGKPTGPQCRLGEGPEGRANMMIARSLLRNA